MGLRTIGIRQIGIHKPRVGRLGSSSSYWTRQISNLGGTGTITTAELSSLTIPKGGTLFFNKGETFDNFTLNISVDDVTIDSYGSGAAPVLSGSSVVATGDWTSEGSGV